MRLHLSILLTVACSCSLVAGDSLVEKILDPRNGVEYEETVATSVRSGVYAFDAFGSKYRIDTRAMNSTLFAADFQHLHFHHDGTSLGEQNHDARCVFDGIVERKVQGQETVSQVFGCINLCQGYFTGHIMTDGDKHISFTAYNTKRRNLDGAPVKILAYNAETLNELEHYSFGAVHASEVVDEVKDAQQWTGVRSRRLASSRIKYIQLLIVNDFERYKSFLDKTQAEAANAIQYTSFLYNKLNVRYRNLRASNAYSFSISIAGMITFSHGNPWRNVLKRNGKEVDTTQLLELFNEWRENQLSGRQFPAHSAAHLLSGEDFGGNTVGLAYLQRICSNSAATGINQGSGFTHTTLGTIVAHELAHNLGVFHTSEPPPTGLSIGTCRGGIMGPQGITEDDWTDCTIEYLEAFFDGTSSYPRIYDSSIVPACLEQRPTFVWGLEAQCGNGLKEAGEQCDCGAEDCGDTDPCCDGKTCKFTSSEHECSATELCCTDECKIFDPIVAGENKVCRQKVSSSCDIEEVCDGQTAQCPPDKFEVAGKGCRANDNSLGTCFAGNCLSHSSQCSEYVSYGATGPCENFGGTSGDAACGDLHCQIGNRGCERILKQSEFVKVYDGTKCSADGQVCDVSNQKCVPPDQVSLPNKITCSNGVLDEGETDVDCGGPDCFPCFPGEKCLRHTDCVFGQEGTDYICYDSTYTTTKNLSGSAPTDFERPADGKCTDFQDEEACGAWSGCVWIGEYSSIQINKCKNTGWYPNRNGALNFDSPAACRSQRKMESCINWIFCDWNWESNSCTEVDRSIVLGQCTGDQPFGRETLSWFDKVVQWVMENRILAIGIALFAALLLLSCTCSCVTRCRRRSNLIRIEREHKGRVARQAQIPVSQARPSPPQQQGLARKSNPETRNRATPQVSAVTVVNQQPDFNTQPKSTLVSPAESTSTSTSQMNTPSSFAASNQTSNIEQQASSAPSAPKSLPRELKPAETNSRAKNQINSSKRTATGSKPRANGKSQSLAKVASVASTNAQSSPRQRAEVVNHSSVTGSTTNENKATKSDIMRSSDASKAGSSSPKAKVKSKVSETPSPRSGMQQGAQIKASNVNKQTKRSPSSDSKSGSAEGNKGLHQDGTERLTYL